MRRVVLQAALGGKVAVNLLGMSGIRIICLPIALVSAIGIAQGQSKSMGVVVCRLAGLTAHVGNHGYGGSPEGGSLRSVGIDISVGTYHFT